MKQGLQRRYKRSVAKLASTRYGSPALGMRVIVVAGYAGKTTTARLVGEILRESGHPTAVLTNLGFDINGVMHDVVSYDRPAKLQKYIAQARKANVEFIVVELTPYMIKHETLAATPLHAVVITAVSDDYMSIAKDLCAHVSDFTILPHTAKDVLGEHLSVSDHQIISFGDHDEAEARISNVKLYAHGTELRVTIDHQTHISLATYLVGTHNAHNVAAAVAGAYILGIPISAFEEGVARVESVPGNYQYLPKGTVYTAVTDGATNESSLTYVVDTAKTLTKRRLIVVVDGVEISDDTLRVLAGTIDRLIIVSDNDGARAGVEYVQGIENAVLVASRGARINDTLLIVGPGLVATAPSGDTWAQTFLYQSGSSDDKDTMDMGDSDGGGGAD